MAGPEPPYQVALSLAAIPPEGRTLRLEPGPEQRAAIARFLGVTAIPSLEAEARLARLGEGAEAVLAVRAEIEQPCVLTLEPVRTVIAFTAARRYGGAQGGDEDVLLDLEAEDPPDPLEGGMIDLGAFLLEELALNLDPYPRAPGAALPDLDGGAAGQGPFAGLARLRRED